jgi:hypothetical protein
MRSDRSRSLMLIGVLFALIASAVFANTAMAAGGEWGHEKSQWTVEGNPLNEGETALVKFWELGPFEGSQSMNFEWSISGLPVRFSCSNGEGEGELIGPASGRTSLMLSGCTVSNIPTCLIEDEQIYFNPLEFNLSGDTATLRAQEGFTALFVLHTTGASCPIPGNRPVKGWFAANLGGEGEQLEHVFSIDESAMSSPAGPLAMRGWLLATLLEREPGTPQWYVGAGILPAGQHESVECEVGQSNGEESFTLVGQVGTTKVPFRLDASGVECVETSIFNGADGEVGRGAGKLRFTGVTVSEPANCTVENGEVESNPLNSTLIVDPANPKVVFDKFEPAEGFTGLGVVRVIGEECAAAGNRPIRGSLYGEMGYEAGTHAVKQPLEFSAAIEEAATGETNLKFASNPAELTGQVITRLSGADAGKEFWVK